MYSELHSIWDGNYSQTLFRHPHKNQWQESSKLCELASCPKPGLQQFAAAPNRSNLCGQKDLGFWRANLSRGNILLHSRAYSFIKVRYLQRRTTLLQTPGSRRRSFWGKPDIMPPPTSSSTSRELLEMKKIRPKGKQFFSATKPPDGQPPWQGIPHPRGTNLNLDLGSIPSLPISLWVGVWTHKHLLRRPFRGFQTPNGQFLGLVQSKEDGGKPKGAFL